MSFLRNEGVYMDSRSKRGLWLSSDSIVTASRTTTSDVMCIVNTQKALAKSTLDIPRYKSLKPIATLPYKFNSKPKLSEGNTDFSSLKNVELKEKGSLELKRERERFFRKLERERNEKTYRESASIVKIQAIVRGFLARPRTKPRRKKVTVPFLVPGAPVSDEAQEIQNELCSYAQMLGLKPIPGLSLEARAKHNRRREKIILAASIRISTFFKLTLIALRAKKTAESAKKNIQQRASVKIQKFFRFVRREVVKRKTQSWKRERAVLKIQTRFRIFHDFRRYLPPSPSFLKYSPSLNNRVRELRRQRFISRREDDARIILYRNIIKDHELLIERLRKRKEEKERGKKK
jgi:hypothetical protein